MRTGTGAATINVHGKSRFKSWLGRRASGPPVTSYSLQADLRGVNRLIVDASVELTHLVEEMHRNIVRPPWRYGDAVQTSGAGLTGSIYAAIRELIGAIGAGVDVGLSTMPVLDRLSHSSQHRDVLRAALNGVVGDHLAATGNPLAIGMHVRHAGAPLELDEDAIGAAIQRPSRKLLVLIHGLCLGDMHWRRGAHDHGQGLSQALGYTPLYLRYNSGLHISTNGRQATELLEALIAQWPVAVNELVIVGHSMGGLVARSACDIADASGMRWPRSLRKLVFLGTPHHGAPLERGGHWLQTLLGRHPWTTALARLGRLRSAGITDLRRGCLCDEDWAERDRFEHPLHPLSPVPLPDGVDCYALAGALHNPEREIAARLLGDGLVPIKSAFGDHEESHLSLGIPESRRRVALRVGHLGMLGHEEVYNQMHRWLKEGERRAGKRVPAGSSMPARKEPVADQACRTAPGDARARRRRAPRTA